MKKKLIVLLAGGIFIATFLHSAKAQGTNNVSSFTESKSFMKSLQVVISLDNPVDLLVGLVDLNTVNAKAVKDFRGRFSKITGEKWFTIPDGFITYFKQEGLTTRVFYNRKGQWQYTLKFYHEDNLPGNIRKIVKSTYYDCAITIIEEVEAHDNLVYIVHLEDKTSIKNVRVSKDGEMDVMEEFQKSE